METFSIQYVIMFSITWSFYTNVRLKATEKKNGLVGACTLC